MKKLFFIVLTAVMLLASCSRTSEWDRLNSLAQEEYNHPIRPGGVDGSPFWNVYSWRFIYAPAFDFSPVEGAKNYRFSIFTNLEDQEPNLLASFVADRPTADLGKVWGDIPASPVKLVVEALDAKGNVTAQAGSREFVRDFPFSGPYPAPVRDYRESAIKGLLYVHCQPQVCAWAFGTGPDMSYPMNAYVCKIIGATVRIECMLARELEYIHDEAMGRALAAGQYLADLAQTPGQPLEGWPPTYGLRPDDRGGFVDGIVLANEGKTMTLEATVVGEAFLDLFDATADSVWFRRSLAVASTYARIQREDGSWPMKLYYETGEPANSTSVFPTQILKYLRRLSSEYGVTEFEECRSRADAFIRDYVSTSFDLTGQFEDNDCDWTDPYSNLTNITGSGFASYLLGNDGIDAVDVANCMDMLRLSEDQFVHWDSFLDWRGYKRTFSPCVYEQRAYEEAIDDSAATVAEGYLALYEYNGDKLAFAKAEALLDSITRGQCPTTGQIPTVMAYTDGWEQSAGDFWYNCTFWTASALLHMDRIKNR